MSRAVLILRPQPGADETARRARAIGLEPVTAPLFTVAPVAWEAPDPAGFDALMLTSANAPRHAGPALDRFRGLAAFAVGEATAAAAEATGFADVRSGPADAAALARMIAEAGFRKVFHPCGADHVEPDASGLEISSVPVYAATPTERLPDAAAAALDRDALVLLHSPRAAARFAALIGGRAGRVRIAAISDAAAAAAGDGWRSVEIAAAPRDHALLELAAKLCQTDRVSDERTSAGE